MKLHKAFNIQRGDVVAFIGAGGKTSTLIALGHELADLGWRVLATTTTKIGRDQLELMPGALTTTASTDAISKALNSHKFVFLHGEITAEKVYGMTLEQIAPILDTVDSDVLLIEADGSRGLPMKAPKAHEPVIPSEATLVVPVVAINVLGQPLDEDHVYNAEAINERYGFGIGNRVKSPWVAQVLRDEHLMLRGVPTNARLIALINQVPENGYMRGRARLIAQLALRARTSKRRHKDPDVRLLNGVALGSVRASDPIHEVQRPVGAIVLAAGMSTRMGQMKVLMPWIDNKPILEHILQQLLLARIDYITVVTGHMRDEVRQIAKKMDVDVAYNVNYATGEMLSSLKTGLQAMPDHIAAALIVLGDQPRIQPKTVSMVMAAYAEGQGDIVAPSHNMRRGHPILIDRRYWNDLLTLPSNGAPRDVINANEAAIAYVNINNDSVLKDVDTPQAYQEERRKAGLDS